MNFLIRNIFYSMIASYFRIFSLDTKFQLRKILILKISLNYFLLIMETCLKIIQAQRWVNPFFNFSLTNRFGCKQG